MNPFTKIRVAAQNVSESAEYVRTEYDKIPAYAQSLLHAMENPPSIDPDRHFLGQGEKTLAYLIILDTINFGSGYFPVLQKRPGMTGYFTIASSLKDYFVQHRPFTAQELQAISKDDCARIFHQSLEVEPVNELMRHFTKALNDLGQLLLERYEGQFTRLVEDAQNSAERLIDILTMMPLFQDAAAYKGLEVPFYKRAQITAADLHTAFDGKGFGAFHDLDRLTIFADNLVPHVLRMDEILVYDDGLADRIDSEQLIPSGSPEEIEIRACALHAVELMVQSLTENEYSTSPMRIDNLLWNRGQQPRYKAHPRHRTRSVYY